MKRKVVDIKEGMKMNAQKTWQPADIFRTLEQDKFLSAEVSNEQYEREGLKVDNRDHLSFTERYKRSIELENQYLERMNKNNSD